MKFSSLQQQWQRFGARARQHHRYSPTSTSPTRTTTACSASATCAKLKARRRRRYRHRTTGYDDRVVTTRTATSIFRRPQPLPPHWAPGGRQRNLAVADSGNRRVLHFPTPFSHQGNQQADLVLSKTNFSTPPITDPTARNISSLRHGFRRFEWPAGVDQGLNRVLFIPFTNGPLPPRTMARRRRRYSGRRISLPAGRAPTIPA